MYKKASKFSQSSPHTAVGRDDSLIPVPTCSARYAEILRYLLEKTETIGASKFIEGLADFPLARLIVALSTETTSPNHWLYSVCMDVDELLHRHGPKVRLSAYQRRVAQTVIPEIVNRARNSAEII